MRLIYVGFALKKSGSQDRSPIGGFSAGFLGAIYIDHITQYRCRSGDGSLFLDYCTDDAHIVGVIHNSHIPHAGAGHRMILVQDRWADAVYVSTDPDINDGEGEHWMVFGLLHEGILERGQSYSQTLEFTLPPGPDAGYIVIKTNVDPSLILTADVQLLKEMAAVSNRINETIGDIGNMSPAQINAKLDSLTKRDLENILWGEEEVAEVWEGPFTENNARAAECAPRSARPAR